VGKQGPIVLDLKPSDFGPKGKKNMDGVYMIMIQHVLVRSCSSTDHLLWTE